MWPHQRLESVAACASPYTLTLQFYAFFTISFHFRNFFHTLCFELPVLSSPNESPRLPSLIISRYSFILWLPLVYYFDAFNLFIIVLGLFIFLAMIVVLCFSACLLRSSKTHAFLLLSIAFVFLLYFSPDYKTLYPWASSDLLGETSDFTTHASILMYRNSKPPKSTAFLEKSIISLWRLCLVGRMSQFIVTSCWTYRARSTSFIPPFSKKFSFAFPFPILREPFLPRSTSPLPSSTQTVGHFFGHFLFCATTSTICRQWMYSFISSKPKPRSETVGEF